MSGVWDAFRAILVHVYVNRDTSVHCNLHNAAHWLRRLDGWWGHNLCATLTSPVSLSLALSLSLSPSSTVESHNFDRSDVYYRKSYDSVVKFLILIGQYHSVHYRAGHLCLFNSYQLSTRCFRDHKCRRKIFLFHELWKNRSKIDSIDQYMN